MNKKTKKQSFALLVKFKPIQCAIGRTKRQNVCNSRWAQTYGAEQKCVKRDIYVNINIFLSISTTFLTRFPGNKNKDLLSVLKLHLPFVMSVGECGNLAGIRKHSQRYKIQKHLSAKLSEKCPQWKTLCLLFKENCVKVLWCLAHCAQLRFTFFIFLPIKRKNTRRKQKITRKIATCSWRIY